MRTRRSDDIWIRCSLLMHWVLRPLNHMGMRFTDNCALKNPSYITSHLHNTDLGARGSAVELHHVLS